MTATDNSAPLGVSQVVIVGPVLQEDRRHRVQILERALAQKVSGT
jgi:hypothetical protein